MHTTSQGSLADFPYLPETLIRGCCLCLYFQRISGLCIVEFLQYQRLFLGNNFQADKPKRPEPEWLVAFRFIYGSISRTFVLIGKTIQVSMLHIFSVTL